MEGPKYLELPGGGVEAEMTVCEVLVALKDVMRCRTLVLTKIVLGRDVASESY